MDIPAILREIIRLTGWGQTKLAEEIGVNQSDISRYLTGREPRRLTLDTIMILAKRHGIVPTEEEESGRAIIPIMGFVGAGGDIEPDFEQVPPDGLEQIELPERLGLVDDPIGFRVRGESMMPRYNDGDIVVVEREQPWATDSMLGEEAVIRTGDGHRYLKRLRPGARKHTYNLVSLGGAPTIESARVAWASPIRVIIPSVGIRRLPARLSPSVKPRRGTPRSAKK